MCALMYSAASFLKSLSRYIRDSNSIVSTQNIEKGKLHSRIALFTARQSIFSWKHVTRNQKICHLISYDTTQNIGQFLLKVGHYSEIQRTENTKLFILLLLCCEACSLFLVATFYMLDCSRDGQHW